VSLPILQTETEKPRSLKGVWTVLLNLYSQVISEEDVTLLILVHERKSK